MGSYWQSWSEINTNIAKRDGVYFYGRSEDWVHKALKSVKGQVMGIVDRNSAYYSEPYLDLQVLPLDAINAPANNYFVITAGEFEGIIENLEAIGLRPGIDFSCSPDFYDYNKVTDFSTCNASLVIACSDYNDVSRARSSRSGGGLYTFDSGSDSLVKKITGSYRQIEISGSRLFAVEYVQGSLDIFDLEFNQLDSIDLPGSNLCGLALDDTADTAFIANAGTDEIIEYNLNSGNVRIHKQFVRDGDKREAHVNDLCYENGKLFVSYFSASGNYKYGVFDGGVGVIDFECNDNIFNVIGNLWKPHSPRILDGYLYTLDSMRGELINGKHQSIGKFPGFVRGLDKDGELVVVGQSQDMYISEHLGTGRTVSIDPGVYLFQPTFQIQKFYRLPEIMNIHDVRILNVYRT